MSRWKTLLFSIIAVLLFFSLLTVIDQLLGRLNPPETGGLDFVNVHRQVRTMIAELAATEPEPQEIRVYLFGGSTMKGVPFEPLLESWIELFLTEINPQRKIRIVNCAVGAGGSYRAMRLIEDVLREGQKPGNTLPDALILYSGHNEYLDYNNRPLLALEHSPVPGLVEGLRSSWLINRFFTQRDGFFTRPNRALAPGGLKGKVARDFGKNVDRIIKLARRRKVGLVLCSPASNLAYWPPVGDAAAEHYQQALELTEKGKHEQALEQFTLARDKDAMATRAATEILIRIKEKPAAPLLEVLDFDNEFFKESEKRAPGRELFLDNCHPTRRGFYLLARSMAKAAQRFVDPEQLIYYDRYRQEGKYQWASDFEHIRKILEANREKELLLLANLETVNGRLELALEILNQALGEYPWNPALNAKYVSVLWSRDPTRQRAISELTRFLAVAEVADYLRLHAQDKYYFPGLAEALEAVDK